MSVVLNVRLHSNSDDLKLLGWANLQSQHTWCLTYCYNHQTHLPADVVVAYGLMETFDAPITELVTWYYPLALLNQEFEAILIQTFSNFALGLSGSTPGHAGGSACGWSLAPVNFQGHLCKAFTGFIGWQSVGAHLQHTEDPAFQIGIRCLQLEGCVGVFVRHIPLRARLDRIL